MDVNSRISTVGAARSLAGRVGLLCALSALLLAPGCSQPRTVADLASLSPGQIDAARARAANVDGEGRLALEGYDAVSYFGEAGPQRGSTEFTATHLGATYRFASEDHRQAFIRDPERYTPAYGGWCATAMADSGNRVDVDPSNYRIDDGRLYLFFKFLFIDARPAWADDPAASRARADANWRALLATTAEGGAP